jgi:hypothetical protein
LNLKIRGVDFVTSLICLDSKGIDVILGMDWLSKYKVPIEVLRSPQILPPRIGMNLEYIAKSVVIDKGAANRVKLNQLDVSQ